MTEDEKPRLVGINHVALEVGDVEAALDFYGRIFRFRLRGEHRDEAGRLQMAFIDMGDQFLALAKGHGQKSDLHRHFGLVVDERSTVEALARTAGAEMIEGDSLDFRDPWGNRIQAVAYRDLQFLKHEAVLKALGVAPEKTADALRQLSEKGALSRRTVTLDHSDASASRSNSIVRPRSPPDKSSRLRPATGP